MSWKLWRRSLAPLGVVALVVAINAPLLDDFARLLRATELSGSPADAPTHFLRMMHARDLFLASGHRWGWDPYWFQGYVPFLLYPHLPYIVLAGLADLVPLSPARLFNAYTLVLYVLLPIVPSLVVLRSKGAAQALIVACWLAVLSTYGAGFKGVFGIGLLAQQAGVVLFALFAHDLVLSRRFDRAAIWLGLIPLVHVHSALVAAFAWAAVGIHAAMGERQLRPWLQSSMLALLIAAPTVVGLIHGWHRIGGSTSLRAYDDPLTSFVDGSLVAPFPALVAIAVGTAISARSASVEKRGYAITCAAVGVALALLASTQLETGMATMDRVLGSMTHLRAWPYAYVWLALLAVDGWTASSRRVRVGIVALTILAAGVSWEVHSRTGARIGVAWPPSKTWTRQTLADYESSLAWIAGDVRGETTTVALVTPRPLALAYSTASRILRMPLLGGHGIELTSIRNSDLLYHWDSIDCTAMRRQVAEFSVGYVVGSAQDHRDKVSKCLGKGPTFQQGNWWVFETGKRWSSVSRRTNRFTRNRTWTEMRWQIAAGGHGTRLRLPVANAAPWRADFDGESLPISTSPRDMMEVTLPAKAGRLTLRYLGFAGEWESVVVGFGALAAGLVRLRRRTAVAPPIQVGMAVGKA